MLVKEILRLYLEKNIPRASAALCYFLTMTFFPLIICLYALFGRSYATALRVMNHVEQFLAPDAIVMFRDYLRHVSRNPGRAIVVAAVTILITSASAAVRVLQSTIGEMQGGQRFRVWGDLLLSFLLAFALVFALYSSMAVMLTGHDFLVFVKRYLPIRSLDTSWVWIRYLLPASFAPTLLWGLFTVTKRRTDHYRVLPGALLSTLAIALMSLLFSGFIAASARYSLVYGSLASLILLMFWLYITCQIIFIGAAFNVALRNVKERRPQPGG